MRHGLAILSVFIFLGSYAQYVDIGLFHAHRVTAVKFTAEKGNWKVFAGDSIVDSLVVGNTCTIRLAGGECSLEIPGKERKIATVFELRSDSVGAQFGFQGISIKTKYHSYHGSITFKANSNKLLLVNKVSLADYLGGVIESEGGAGRHPEYYKVQALMSRTYALKNKDRHRKDGFGLCDGVHCQAYHNRWKHDPNVKKAVEATRYEVIVDQNERMVDTYFYANCGGETSDASFVWNISVDYCQPFRDTFCIHTRQATWTKRISRSKWEKFLVSQYDFPFSDSLISSMAYQFKQVQRRAFYVHPALGVPLRDLRREFRLKSTFFDVSLDGDEVVLQGRGFGHGVGLCQEGAMEMAKAGYHYSQIALYYFENVKLIRAY